MDWRSIDESSEWRSIAESEASPAPAPLRISSRPREIVIRGLLATEPVSFARLHTTKRFTAALLAAALIRFVGWSASVAGHFVLFAILMGILVMSRKEGPETYVEMGFSQNDGGNQGALLTPPGETEKPAPKPEPAPKEVPIPEPQKVEAPKPPEPVPPAPDVKEVGKSAEDSKTTPLPVPAAPDPKPAAIGAGGGATAAPTKGAADASAVEKDPTAAVAARRAGEIAQLKKGKKREIVVVTGAYDRVEAVLEKLGVPHTVIEPDDLPRHDLSDCGVLLVNCNNAYAVGSDVLPAKELERVNDDIATLKKRVDDLEKRIADAEKRKDRKTAMALNAQMMAATATLEYKQLIVAATENANKLSKKMNEFVGKGGYLFTSDWGLTLLSQAFPTAVKTGGYVGPKSVRIAPKRGLEGHALLPEVFEAKAKGTTTTAPKALKWEIDGSSYLIKIEDPKVETIIETPDLASNRSIAVTFLHDGRKVVEAGEESGRTSKPGRVLHILSHFFNQQDRFGDYGLQNLLVNFLVARIERK